MEIAAKVVLLTGTSGEPLFLFISADYVYRQGSSRTR
jgi:hypothetical protein